MFNSRPLRTPSVTHEGNWKGSLELFADFGYRLSGPNTIDGSDFQHKWDYVNSHIHYLGTDNQLWTIQEGKSESPSITHCW